MPIYEYRCPSCKKRVSVFFRSFSAAQNETPVCPECGGGGLVRLVSLVAKTRGSGDDDTDFGGGDDFGGDDEFGGGDYGGDDEGGEDSFDGGESLDDDF